MSSSTSRRILLSVCGDELAEPRQEGQAPTASPLEQAARAQILQVGTVAGRFFWFPPNYQMVNVTALDGGQLEKVAAAFQEADITVRTIASPVGKSWLTPDGGPEHAKYMTPDEVMNQLEGAIRAAKALGAKMVRIFPGYPANWSLDSTDQYTDAAVEFLRPIAARLADEGLIGVVENEKYLSAPDGKSLVEVLRSLRARNLLIALDPGNLQHLGYTSVQIIDQFIAVMKAGLLGSVHLKECGNLPPNVADVTFTEKDIAPYHVVAGTGSADFAGIFGAIASNWQYNIIAWFMLNAAGIDGLDCMVEGHLKSGGPFHGSSGKGGVEQIIDSMTTIWKSFGFDVVL